MKNLRIYIMLSFLLSLSACNFIVRPIAGWFKYSPEEMDEKMSLPAKNMVKKALAGIDKTRFADMHVHLVGIGTGKTGLWVNDGMTTGFNLFKRAKFHVYMSASGITEIERADQQYIKRLLKLSNAFGRTFKLHIFAFDYFYHKDGLVDKERSTFYVPNEYAYNLAEKYPDRFVPVISVNPYRKDAIKELSMWGEKGVKKVKWLPNAQGINPADKTLVPFYLVMKKYDMVLISHGGEEKAVDGEEAQALGNPLLLRLPLSMGIKVVVAHLATLGKCSDIDNSGKKESCYDLFIRMMDNPKYDGLLFGDISGITIYTRVDKLSDILSRQDIHHRLVNGSDYPLPGVNVIYKTGELVDLGFIKEEERELINEIYSFNPLLFDFVLKRIIRDPKTGNKFKNQAFELPTWY